MEGEATREHRALARKYRPQSFEAMIGQGAVVQTLKNALNTRKIHPAYIFSGIRGVGKTTAARLFARGLNCESGPTAQPCGSCASCAEIKESRSMDVLEIDAASNTQVESTRDLMQAARYMPVRDRYRVFIIDEVHMLSTHSFNALLKTLEEPPPHAIFLLATTEPHKIPETIHSRAQHFQFRRVPAPQVAQFLEEVCRAEGIEAQKAALELLSRSGEGSVRDSLTLLDRLRTYADGPITEDAAAEVLGVLGREALMDVAQKVTAGDTAGVSACLDAMRVRGQNPERFLSDLGELVRQLVHMKAAPQPTIGRVEDERLRALASGRSLEDLLRLWDLLMVTLQRLKGAPDPDAVLELQLVKAALLPRILPLSELIRATSPQEAEPHVSQPSPASAKEMPASEEDTGEGLRFKALIPFQRMDDSEARSYEGKDEKAQAFKDLAARKIPLAGSSLERASLSLDPEGVLHVLLPSSSATAGALFNSAERRRLLEEVAREAGYPGRVVVEAGRAETETPAPRHAGAEPPARSLAVQNVIKILGGQVVSTSSLTETAPGGTDAKSE